jgi:hypothetical protein
MRKNVFLDLEDKCFLRNKVREMLKLFGKKSLLLYFVYCINPN